MIPANLISALFNINILVVIPPVVVTASIIGSATRLLLKTTGVDASANNIFLDSSINGLAITRAGNTAQGSFSPYSPAGWGVEFNGTSDSLALAANTVFDFGTGDFTVEVWVYNVPTTNSYPSFISSQAGWSAGASGHRFDNVGYSNKFWMGLNGSAGVAGGDPFMVSTNTFNHNQWYHYAITRVGNTWRMFVDGVLQNTQTFSGTYNLALAGMRLGNSPWDGAGGYWSGSLSNLRIIKGTALYNSDFIPSTSTLAAITGTSLLALQSNRFVDNSVNGVTLTPAGTPKVVPVSPFVPTAQYSPALHGGSLYFDGTGDWLQAINTPLLNLTADFTIEFWSYLDNSATFQIPVGANAGGEMMIAIGYPANSISIGQHNVAWNSTFTGHNIPSKVWTHIALVRANSVLKCFVNGVQLGASSSNAVQYTSSGVRIGANESGYFVTGYLSNLRIVKGSAVYTANFVPPTAPLSTIAGTSLLLHGVNAGIYDASARRNIETVGTSQVSAAVKKYQSSVFLPGGASYLSVVDSNNQLLYAPLGDFTIELWVRTGSALAYTTLVSSDNGAFTAGSWALLFDSAGQVAFWSSNYSGGAPVIASGSVIVNNNRWNHVAIQRSASTFTLFINGITAGSATSAFTQALNPTNILIGAQSGYARNLIGYIEDVRISAYAVYSANFTPPILKVVGFYSADDEYFNNNSLVVQTTGTNNGTNSMFSDQGPNALAVTAQGPAGQGNFSPYGSAFSAKFGGTDYVSLPASSAYGLGASDFTLECYIFRNTKSSNTVLEFRTAVTASATVLRITESNFLSVYDGPANFERLSSLQVPIQQWAHIAVVRKTGILSFFIDGVLDPTTHSVVSNLGASCPCFIGFNQTAGHGHRGLISNVRITKAALYTNSFTPDLANLTNVANTTLLCLQDSRFKDNSVSAAVVTSVGTTIARTNQLPRSVPYDRVTEGSSIYLNGTSSYLTVPHSALTTFNNVDFTVEMWVYPEALTGYRTLFNKNAADGVWHGFNIQLQDNVPKLWSSSGGGSWDIANALGTTAIRIGEWAHIAVTRTLSGGYSLWVNGVLSGSSSSTLNYLDNGSALGVGSFSGSAYRIFNGYVSDLRLVKGAALYTAPFTHPTAALTAIGGTALLLNGSDANVSDATGRNDISLIGGAKVSTDVSKFTGSIYFNGTTDSLLIGKDASIFGTGDFTIDFWVRPIAFASGYRILFNGEVSGAFGSAINSSGTITCGRTLIGTDGTTTNAVVFGQWNHIVFRRANSTIQIFINGVRGLSVASGFDYVQSAVRVGADAGGTTYNFNGYLEDFRMTAGKLRYTVEPKSAL